MSYKLDPRNYYHNRLIVNILTLVYWTGDAKNLYKESPNDEENQLVRKCFPGATDLDYNSLLEAILVDPDNDRVFNSDIKLLQFQIYPVITSEEALEIIQENGDLEYDEDGMSNVQIMRSAYPHILGTLFVHRYEDEDDNIAYDLCAENDEDESIEGLERLDKDALIAFLKKTS